MSTVTLKVVGPPDPAHQQVVRVKRRPAFTNVRVMWTCGLCCTYASRNDTYRAIDKACPDHSCLIPKEGT